MRQIDTLHFYNKGIVYIVLGIILYIATPYLLDLVHDRGDAQEKMLRIISLFFVVIGILLSFIKINSFIICLIVITFPCIVSSNYYK